MFVSQRRGDVFGDVLVDYVDSRRFQNFLQSTSGRTDDPHLLGLRLHQQKAVLLFEVVHLLELEVGTDFLVLDVVQIHLRGEEETVVENDVDFQHRVVEQHSLDCGQVEGFQGLYFLVDFLDDFQVDDTFLGVVVEEDQLENVLGHQTLYEDDLLFE